MAVFEGALRGYHYVFDELSDPRSKNYWLVSGPGPLLTILASYLYFCTIAGPKFMQTRKPYNLKTVLMLYNVLQICLSLYMTYVGVYFYMTEKYVDGCYMIDTSDSPRAMMFVAGIWWFYIGKLTELLDTVFFVLRKKERQISFLHLYHHTIMPILAFVGIKYAAGGQSVPEGTINTFIHIVMYTYYLISGLGPQFQKYLWWKKHLTTMQLIQFCIVAFMNVNSYFSTTCNYPKFLTLIVLSNCVAFFYMFGRFYYLNYVASKKTKNIKANHTTDSNTKLEKDS